MGPKVAAGRSAERIPIPTQFDVGVDDAMSDAHAETNNIFEQLNKDVEANKRAMKEQVSQHLGPDSATGS